MAASSCYGNQNAKLEIVSIAKLSKRRHACAAGSCLPRPPGAPARGLVKQLKTSRMLGCIPGAGLGTSISQTTAPLPPPSLSRSSASAFLTDMARRVCVSHYNSPQRQSSPPAATQAARARRAPPALAGHVPGGRMPPASITRAALPNADENAFRVQSISTPIFHHLAQSRVQQSQRKGFCISTKCKIFNGSLACA